MGHNGVRAGWCGWWWLVVLIGCKGAAPAAVAAVPTIFVAAGGDDAAPGTAERPLATLGRAVARAKPGDWIEVRGGTYHLAAPLRLGTRATAGAPIRLWARDGEHVVLDATALPHDDRARGVTINGSHWHMRGLEVTGAWDNGINVSGAHNTIERCVVHDCGDSGIQLSQPASHTLVLECDSYRNYDAPTHGENADGFAAKLALGPGNVFRGCRAWENADDGYDLWRAPEPILLEDCSAWRNGENLWGDPAFTGNGNGFKLGGDRVPGAHRVVRCVAWGHRGAGFTQNNNPGPLTLLHNTSFANGRSFSIYLAAPAGAGAHALRNNLAFDGELVLRTAADARGNSWQLPADLGPVDANDVTSTATAELEAPRGPDGARPPVSAWHPTPGGRLHDRGEPCGMPFKGAAPDTGAFEE